MEELTTILFIIAIVVFLLRYVLRSGGVDFLSAILGLCALLGILQDETILENQLILVFIPTLLITMYSFLSLMFGKDRRKF